MLGLMKVTYMSLDLKQKKAVVTQVAEVASSALSAVAAEYNGVDANNLNVLRASARSQGVHLQVVKNSLAKRAFEGTDFECMQEGMVGPLVLAFSKEDPGAAARVIRDFVKDNEAMKVKLVSLGGKLLSPDDLSTLAKMPTYDQAISLLMAVMKAPVEKFVRTLNEPTAKMVRTVDAIRASKA
jgi:large subunit ribosomal protein L10